MTERTLCLITPDAVGQPWVERVQSKNDEDEVVEVDEVRSDDKSKEIIARIQAAGLTITTQKTLRITKDQARTLFADRVGTDSYDALCDHVSSGLLVALVIEGPGAIAELRKLMGPADSATAFAESEAAHPLNEELWTLRASFGTDRLRNAVHGSADEYAALREVEFFFPEASRYERTLAIIKPEVVSEGKVDAVLRDLESNEFIIVAQKPININQVAAEDLYRDSREASNFPALVSSTVGDAVALIVERKNAIKLWRLKVGADVTRFHAAPSSRVVEKQISLFFDAEAVPVERTLALIKPGVADKFSRDIKRDIAAHGFTILAERRAHLSREHAEAFYAEHAGKSFFDALTSYMSSGPVVAMVLAKPAGIKCWRALLGPTNTFVAKQQAPNTIRARFGQDGTRNAGHGSDSPSSAAREIRFFFPDFQPSPLLTGTPARTFLSNRKMATVFSTAGPVSKTLTSVLVEGLTELCKARPSGLAAVEWLGQWLLQNNPRTGRVSEAGVVSRGVAGAGAGAGAGSSSVGVEVLETKLNEPAAETLSLGASSVVFLVGGPGSGRAALAQRLAKGFGYEHISTGDLLRAEAAKGTPLGREVKTAVETGDLVDDATVLAIVKTAMKKAGGRRFLVDGFPRSLPQAFAFEQSVQQPSFVLSLEASDATLTERITARASSSGRVDDAPSARDRRLAAFASTTALVLDFYSKLGQVHSIDAEGSEDAVFAAASARLEPEVVFVLGAPAAGKTTLCKRAADKFGFVHVSTGELLRTEAASGSRLGDEIAALQAKGDLVPVSTILALVRRAIDSNPGARFLIDGFPRTAEQAAAFRATVGRARRVIDLRVDEATARKRLSSVSSSRRNDNTRDAITRRLRVHKNATQPVIDMYAKAGLVRAVDATASPDAAFDDMARLLAPTIVFVLGGPGSGKGTVCSRLRTEFGFTHLSVGDLLRAEVARQSPDGAMISRMIQQGQIVPVDVVLGLLKRAMVNSGNARFLVDGYPRALDQVAPFEEQVGAASFVLFVDTPDAVMRERMASRGRSDDNADAVEKRLVTFHQTSKPVVEVYARRGKVVRVDGAQSIEGVYAEARAAFAPRLLLVTGGPGRATQAQRIADTYGYTHLNVSGLLEAAVTRGGKFADAARDALDSGSRPAADVAAGLLAAAVAECGATKVVVDDFPADADELAALEAVGLVAADAVDVGGVDDALAAALAERGVLRSCAGDSDDGVWANIRQLLRPEVAVLIGASGSGRGEFAKRAGLQQGYHHLRVTQLLDHEVSLGSADGTAIARARSLSRTAPVDATLRVINKAIAGSRASKFLLDGFPRLVSDGFPGVHDQLFALEAAVGPVSRAVCLDAGLAERRDRVGGAPTKGEEAALLRSVDCYEREKLPVVRFLERLGKAVTVNTAGKSPDDVFAEAMA